VRIALLTLLILRSYIVLLYPIELRAGEIIEDVEEIEEENLAVLRYSEIKDNKKEK
jgi:hypothetical protein